MRRRFEDGEHHSRPVVFRLSSLGDVVLATGVLKHWNHLYGMRFTVVTRSEYSCVFKGHPHVESVIGLDPHTLSGTSWYTTARDLARSFRGRPFIDLHGVPRSYLLSFFWSGPVYRYPKYGLERRLYQKRRYPWLEKRLLRATVPQRYARALDRALPPRDEVRPRIHVSDDELKRAGDILAVRKISSPYFVLHPYAAHEAKAWPLKHWKTILEYLEKADLEWVIVGRSDSHFLQDIDPMRDLTNQTDIRMTSAILARSRALLSCDSGPVHLADAVSTPLVALYGPTSRVWGFYPSGPHAVIMESDCPERPCSLHGDARCTYAFACMSSIPPRAVYNALLSHPPHVERRD